MGEYQPSAIAERAIGEYADRVIHQWVGRLSYSERQAILDEVRDHLFELMAEAVESGVSEDEALATTLTEFGDPVDFAQGYLEGRGVKYPDTKVKRFLTSSFVRAYLYFIVPGIVCVNLFQAMALDRHLDWILPATVALTILGPLVAGFITGWSIEDRFLRCVRQAVLLTTLVSLVSGLLLWPKIEGLVLAATMIGLWLPLGCLAAAGGAYLRQTYAWKLRKERSQRRVEEETADTRPDRHFVSAIREAL